MSKNRVHLALLLVTIPAFAAPARGASVPTAFHFHPAAPPAAPADVALIAGLGTPTIDGGLDDKEWASAGRATLDPVPGAPPTFMYALHDEQFLYIAFECHEPQMDKLRAAYSPQATGVFGPDKNGDVGCYEDDSVEVFLYTDDGAKCFAFIANTVGARYDELKANDKEDGAWKGDWEAPAKLGADRWTMEMRIALKSIGADIAALREAKTELRVAFMRNRMAGGGRDHFYWQREGRYGLPGARPMGFLKVSDLAIRDVRMGDVRFGRNTLSQTLVNLASKPRTVKIHASPEAQTVAVALNPGETKQAEVTWVAPGNTVFGLRLNINDDQRLLSWRYTGLRTQSPLEAMPERYTHDPADDAATVFFRIHTLDGNLPAMKVRAKWADQTIEIVPTSRRGSLAINLDKLTVGDHEVQLSLLDAGGKVLADATPMKFTLTNTPRAPETGSVPLRIDLPEKARGVTGSWPVTIGVPFAKGALRDARKVSLVDEAGKQVPVEPRVAQSWNRHDTSVKWLHLDFQVPGNSHGKTYTLRYGGDASPAAPPKPIAAKQDAQTIAIDTGAIRFNVKRDRFGLIDELWHGDKQVIQRGAGNTLTVVDEKGHVFRSVEDEQPRVELELNGPMHSVVRAEGWHVGKSGKKLRYVVRLHAYAGLPIVRVEHTFIMTEGYDAEFPEISMGLHLAPAAGERTWQTAFWETPLPQHRQLITSPVKPSEMLAVTQTDWQAFRAEIINPSLMTASKLLRGGAYGEGWVQVSDAATSIGIYGQDWRENYCKGYDLYRNILRIHLWPPQAGRPLTFHPRGYLPPAMVDALSYDQNGAYFEAATYKDDMREAEPHGAGKTHEFLLDFSAVDEKRAVQVQALANEPAIAILPGTYVRDTGVWGRFSLRDEKRFPVVERAFDALFDQMAMRQHAARDYGLINFGNNKHMFMNRQPGNWAMYRLYAGMGYGLPNQPWLMYVRSGDRKWLAEAHRMTRHVADFSYCHDGPNRGGTGRLSPIHWKYIGPGSGISLHVETQCLMRDYYITGNLRAREVLDEHREVAVNHKVQPGPLTYRGYFDPQKNLIDHYELTWDEQFLFTQQALFDGCAIAFNDWEKSYGHYYAKALWAVHVGRGDPRALELAKQFIDKPFEGGGYGTGKHEDLAAYLYQVTRDPHWIEKVGGETHMKKIMSHVEVEKPLPNRGILLDENPAKPGDWYPDNFICMWMDKLLIKYTYLMDAIADSEQKAPRTQ